LIQEALRLLLINIPHPFSEGVQGSIQRFVSYPDDKDHFFELIDEGRKSMRKRKEGGSLLNA